MIFYRDAAGLYYPTQADARAVDKNFTQTDVPVSKPELLAFLNEQQQEINTLKDLLFGLEEAKKTFDDEVDVDQVAEMVGPVPELTTVAEILPPEPVKPSQSVEDMISELTGQKLIRALSAAITRLGEVAGFHGWAAFAKDVYSWTPSARSTEQGLGMLMLAAFDSLDKRAAPAAPTLNSNLGTDDV